MRAGWVVNHSWTDGGADPVKSVKFKTVKISCLSTCIGHRSWCPDRQMCAPHIHHRAGCNELDHTSRCHSEWDQCHLYLSPTYQPAAHVGGWWRTRETAQGWDWLSRKSECGWRPWTCWKSQKWCELARWYTDGTDEDSWKLEAWGRRKISEASFSKFLDSFFFCWNRTRCPEKSAPASLIVFGGREGVMNGNEWNAFCVWCCRESRAQRNRAIRK